MALSENDVGKFKPGSTRTAVGSKAVAQGENYRGEKSAYWL